MTEFEIDDPELYEQWSYEALDAHIKKLQEVRDRKGGHKKLPSRRRLSEMLDPSSDDFMGSGLPLHQFMQAMDLDRFERSFHRQDRKEKNRRLKYLLRASSTLAEIEGMNIQATGLGHSAVEDLIEGDWSGIRSLAIDFAKPDWIGEIGIRNNPELQGLWQVFANTLMEAFDTRPGVAKPQPVVSH